LANKIAKSLPLSFVLMATEFTARALDRSGAEQVIRSIFAKHGFHLLRKHYYLPIPDEADLAGDFWDRCSDLVGLDMNDRAALELLGSVFARYMDEFRACFPTYQTSDPKQFYLLNGGYMAIDAHVYYAFIRYFKPKQIVEVGAGNSTLLAAAAGMQNLKETGRAPRLIAIEPYPNSLLKEGFPGLSQLIESKVQDVPLDLFTSLESGDILFIDSSHVLRAGGDVQQEYLEILPRLSPGVLVHIHDISLPKPYPRVYFENHLYWNERYLLQAFLTFNARFVVLWAGNYMMIKYPEKVCEVFPEFHIMRQSFPMSEPSAFWMRVQS
jgi:hypothetical protein